MDNMKTKVVLATLVAFGAMIGLGVTFPGGTLPKCTLRKRSCKPVPLQRSTARTP